MNDREVESRVLEYRKRWKFPPVQDEPWYPWLTAHDHEPGLALAVQVAQRVTGVSGAAILAVLWRESRLRHNVGIGQVMRGGGWRAVGIAQVPRHPWEQRLSREIGIEFNFDNLTHNVMACALILERGGWEAGAEVIRLEAYSFYNTGTYGKLTHYGREVLATEMEIRGVAA